MFNDYIDGGFVIYHAPGYRVFVDDRCEVFGGDWLVEFVNASAAEPDGWQAYMERYVNCGEAEYLARVGGLDAIRQLPLPVF